MSSIYNALCSLSAEDQSILLNTYKIPEICCIFKDFGTYYSCICDMFNNINQYLRIEKALSNLYKASQNFAKEGENYNWVEAMENVYSRLPSESQREFIENMAQRQDFFKDAYEVIIGRMSQTLMEQGGEVAQK